MGELWWSALTFSQTKVKLDCPWSWSEVSSDYPKLKSLVTVWKPLGATVPLAHIVRRCGNLWSAGELFSPFIKTAECRHLVIVGNIMQLIDFVIFLYAFQLESYGNLC